MKFDFIKSAAGRVFLPAFILTLAACGGGSEAPRVLTPEEQAIKDQVDARQANFQDLGAAFKAVGDELRAGRPTSPTVIFSIQAIRSYAPQMQRWFPEGTGPDSGFETDSLAAVWDNREAFEQELASFQSVVSEFSAAAAANDGDAIRAQFRVVGESCESCHERFRAEE
ncbi:c-type cytochrome [Ponticaulis koreensis]|uniref:c-type cytochrome n=1 Tax=Ponticaulis koreensis TaxID=1123045 RepID=UPI0003B79CE0|nr:cytochrome c [Ponticaulis koreensis]